MDFIDRIKQIAARAPQQMEYCKTEEATKNALIMPFINALGYDVFNPTEVVPEFTADVGIKKGEKVDYAIMIDDQPVILFECKWSGAKLNMGHESQLHRYFTAVQPVRFVVLTNGIVYQFYSDLDAPNRMDDKPFFVFDILSFQDRDVAELKKFTKSTFDLEEIVTTASDLKYMAALKKLISTEFNDPSDDFVVFLTKQVYSGIVTKNVREQFSDIVKRALRSFVNDSINARLQQAIGDEVEVTAAPQAEAEENEEDVDEEASRKPTINTTEEEIEGFFVIKSILREVVDVKRVQMRDTKSYCGILLDDNNRKPIVRLHFNRTQKYIGIFDSDKNETREPIDEIDDIYKHASAIVATVKQYEENE